jgi:preprotein translocase subunit SecD
MYRLLGVLADLALIIYGLMFWGILNAIGVTLTLPGIAGVILTLGMAVDANVLIFARIREEVAHGKTLRTAFDAGYKKALRSILDANFSTLITAAVLFWAAAGGVRGFALTLAIGVLLSMFTAIVTVQAMLHLLAETPVFKNLALLGLKPPTEKDS